MPNPTHYRLELSDAQKEEYISEGGGRMVVFANDALRLGEGAVTVNNFVSSATPYEATEKASNPQKQVEFLKQVVQNIAESLGEKLSDGAVDALVQEAWTKNKADYPERKYVDDPGLLEEAKNSLTRKFMPYLQQGGLSTSLLRDLNMIGGLSGEPKPNYNLQWDPATQTGTLTLRNDIGVLQDKRGRVVLSAEEDSKEPLVSVQQTFHVSLRGNELDFKLDSGSPSINVYNSKVAKYVPALEYAPDRPTQVIQGIEGLKSKPQPLEQNSSQEKGFLSWVKQNKGLSIALSVVTGGLFAIAVGVAAAYNAISGEKAKASEPLPSANATATVPSVSHALVEGTRAEGVNPHPHSHAVDTPAPDASTPAESSVAHSAQPSLHATHERTAERSRGDDPVPPTHGMR